MGGGGFSMEPENLLLDRYVLKASSKRKPKVCFVPTASGDAQGYIDRFYESFKTMPCKPSHLTHLYNKNSSPKAAVAGLGAERVKQGRSSESPSSLLALGRKSMRWARPPHLLTLTICG
jgi:hypothetical protein